MGSISWANGYGRMGGEPSFSACERIETAKPGLRRCTVTADASTTTVFAQYPSQRPDLLFDLTRGDDTLARRNALADIGSSCNQMIEGLRLDNHPKVFLRPPAPARRTYGRSEVGSTSETKADLFFGHHSKRKSSSSRFPYSRSADEFFRSKG